MCEEGQFQDTELMQNVPARTLIRKSLMPDYSHEVQLVLLYQEIFSSMVYQLLLLLLNFFLPVNHPLLLSLPTGLLEF